MALWSQICAPQSPEKSFGETTGENCYKNLGSNGALPGPSRRGCWQGKERERGTDSCRARSDTKPRGWEKGGGTSQVLLTAGCLSRFTRGKQGMGRSQVGEGGNSSKKKTARARGRRAAGTWQGLRTKPPRPPSGAPRVSQSPCCCAVTLRSQTAAS